MGLTIPLSAVFRCSSRRNLLSFSLGRPVTPFYSLAQAGLSLCFPNRPITEQQHEMNNVLLEDESLRDGLQLEPQVLPVEEKAHLFHLLADAGLQRIQLGSFVNPRLVPQMADTDALVRFARNRERVTTTALVLNTLGLDRAMDCGLTHLTVSVSASNAHSAKNVGKSHTAALQEILPLIRRATAAGITVRAGVQCAFGCIEEGAVPTARIVQALEGMVAAGAREVNLADTPGMATPYQVKKMIHQVNKELPEPTLSLHLHDTRGLGIANMLAGYEAGVRLFDTSVGGLGGCPFVDGVGGNIPTEDAAYLFASLGVATGIDLKKLCQAVTAYEQHLGRKLHGHLCPLLKSLPDGTAGLYPTLSSPARPST